MNPSWEMVVGLEVHAALATQSKVFCGCSTAFGAPPNSQVCPVCLGLPGTLPALNRRAVELAVRTGLALHGRISPLTCFDRKHYVYPDLPKAYQISQLYLPLCRGGWLDIVAEGETRRIGITEMHLEEDAGKLIHDTPDGSTWIDYNRCGIPLLEMVSEPDFRSAHQVVAYLESLREILLFLGVCDGKIQEGSFRADVNLSVRRKGDSQLGTRTEMKNLGSFKAIFRAVNYEAERQISLLESGDTVRQETRRWDDGAGRSHSMRTKENAADYRYFPDPDIPPLALDQVWVEGIAAALPELPAEKRLRYSRDYSISVVDAQTLTASPHMAALFEATAPLCSAPKEAANLLLGGVSMLLRESGILPENLSLSPRHLATLANLLTDGKVSHTAGKEVLTQLFHHGTDPTVYVAERGLLLVNDAHLITQAVDYVLAEHPQSVQDFLGGKDRAFTFLMGQVMKRTGGKSDPKVIHNLLLGRLKD